MLVRYAGETGDRAHQDADRGQENAATVESNIRIAAHAHLWQAIVSTATATQMSGATATAQEE